MHLGLQSVAYHFGVTLTLFLCREAWPTHRGHDSSVGVLASHLVSDQ